MVQIKVNYSEEVNISKCNNGAVFSGGGNSLWVKVSDTTVIEINTGKLIGITKRCCAYPVRVLTAEC